MELNEHKLYWKVALFLLLSGCTSFTELRGEPPTSTATVTGDYRRLATCTAAALQDSPQGLTGLVYTLRDVPDSAAARILGSGTMAANAILEVGFIQRDASVQIEARVVRKHFEARVWRAVEACVGAKVDVQRPDGAR